MNVFYADHHEVMLPDGHRFPMSKYRLLREQLLNNQILHPEELIASGPILEEIVARTHDPGYVKRFLHGQLTRSEMKQVGLPWSNTLVNRVKASTAGTLNAARSALKDGIAGNLAGGTHHAMYDHGEGFCVFNDIAVAANELIHTHMVEKIAVVDLDVHQGNGTAALFHHEPRVFTLSIHGKHNYPFKKVPGDCDYALEDECDDTTYINTLREALDIVLEQRPDIIFYQAGVDAFKEDRLGRLALTMQGLRQRDMLVLSSCERRNIPIVLTLGGGYCSPIKHTVDAYQQTYHIAKEIFQS